MAGHHGQAPLPEVAFVLFHVAAADPARLDPQQALVEADHRPRELPHLEGAGSRHHHGPDHLSH